MKRNMKRNRGSDDGFEDSDDKPSEPHRKGLGQKAADFLTSWVGSWNYIVILTGFLLLWIAINTSFYLLGTNFDPYPFILLNLVLAAIAAIEVPIILMSQNRQAIKDSEREKYDYAVDKKSGKEIEKIREQLDRIEKRLRQ